MDLKEPRAVQPGGREFRMIERSRPLPGAASRQPAGGILLPSGRLALNADGADTWGDVVRASGLDPKHVESKFGVDPSNDLVAAYAVASGSAGAVRVGRSSGAVLHLLAVFQEYPQLRPAVRRSVQVSGEIDKHGVPYLAIHLRAAATASAVGEST